MKLNPIGFSSITLTWSRESLADWEPGLQGSLSLVTPLGTSKD